MTVEKRNLLALCCFGALSLFQTMLHNVFLLYHVDMFLTVLQLDTGSFWLGEVIYLIWNSVNDPILGWLSDPRSSKTDSKQQTSVGRLNSIRLAGPFLALSFCSLWISWGYPLVQFVICLCSYDTFLTILDLQISALLVDLPTTSDGRSRLGLFQSIFSCAGSFTVFLSYYLWDKSDLNSFRVFCTALALIAAFGFGICSTLLSAHIKRHQPDTQSDSQISQSPQLSTKTTFKKFLCQLISQRSFLLFTSVNFIQVLHCHFNSNFFPVFLEVLFSDHKQLGTFILGISFVLPHIANVGLIALSEQYGINNIINALFITKLVTAFFMYLAGENNSMVLTLFIGCNRLFTEGTCRLMVLAIADLIETDRLKFLRPHSVSAAIYGTVNFLGKPGETIAPILGTTIISLLTGRELFSTVRSTLSPPEFGESKVHSLLTDERRAYFYLVIIVPSVCAVLQIILWSRYKLYYIASAAAHKPYLYTQKLLYV